MALTRPSSEVGGSQKPVGLVSTSRPLFLPLPSCVSLGLAADDIYDLPCPGITSFLSNVRRSRKAGFPGVASQVPGLPLSLTDRGREP